jgi:uncharacterized protein (TIGR04255 family)
VWLNNKAGPGIQVELKKPPLVEVIMELRFTPHQESAAELLMGMLFQKLRPKFAQSESLPIALMPKPLRGNPDLKYRPHLKLAGKDQSLLIGDHLVAVRSWAVY